MVKAWYPAGVRTAADRLRYYAGRFNTVEVDSTFYGLPSSGNAQLWAERTPAGFIFHIKAFAMLTRHGVKLDQLPPALRERHTFELDQYGRIVHPTPQIRREVFTLFSEALDPLRQEDKMGLVLMQFPPYFVANEENRAYIAHAASWLAPDRVGVEFRHSSWVQPEEIERTLAFLAAQDLTYVCVDAPRVAGTNVMPPLVAATSDVAYVRFHGRNAATWNARVATAAERFRYLYDQEELREWVEPITHLREQTGTTYVMFNNCYGDYAPKNATQMLGLLGDTASASE